MIKIKILLVTFLFLIEGVVFAEIKQIKVPKYEHIIILKEGEKRKQKYTNIILNIDSSYLSAKKESIPKTFKEAVKLLSQWLDPSVIVKIKADDNVENPIIGRLEFAYDLGKFLEKLWELKTDNTLSLTFQKYGVYSTLPHQSFEGASTGWFLEALLQGVYQFKKTGTIDDVSILMRQGSFAALSTYDFGLDPLNPPQNCNNRINSADALLETRPKPLSTRVLTWSKCENGKIMAYFWERGWFDPDEEVLNKIKLLEQYMKCGSDCSDELHDKIYGAQHN